MILQRMKYELFDEEQEVVCIVNNCQQGGEFTLCGNAIPDGSEFGCIQVGKEFEGKLKDVTCPNCLKMLRWCKSLK